MAISFEQIGSFNGIEGGPSVLANPTVLQFGPDGRLYVSEQNGSINAFTLEIQDGQYVATAHETLELASGLEVVKSIQNHNDDGSENALTDRQITGMVVGGTAENPVIYVASSDSRIAHDEDVGLDTNSGVITRVSWNGTDWEAVDIIRGLPRSEENHSTNGLILSEDGTKLYAMQGGNTNNGAPSSYFSYLSEYTLSGALLEIDLTDIESRPILNDPQGGQGDTARQYVYDLPTLDDPSVANDGVREDANGLDVNGPWGGNDGLNQAILPADAPLRIYADGFRNAYDVVLTQGGDFYTFDNGSNQGLGSIPIYDINGEATNQPNNGGVGDPEPLFKIEDGGYYGHANPTRSNQDGSITSYDDDGNPDASLSAHTIANMADAVPDSVNIQDGFIIDPSKFTGDPARLTQSGVRVLHESPESEAIVLLGSSSNGMTEYVGAAFGGALDGALLVSQFNGTITLLNLNAAGDGLEPLIGPGPDGILGNADDVVEDADGLMTLISGQSQPLDVTIGPDGTIWVAEFGTDNIKVFAPSDLILPDDPDADNDGLLNEVDPFIRDADNGGDVFVMPGQTYFWDFDANQDNNLPGPNGYGGGLTGVMIDGVTDFEQFFLDESPNPGQLINLDNVKFTTAAGGGTTVIEFVSNGDPLAGANSGAFLFHTGMTIAPTTETLTIKWSVVNPAALFTGEFQQIGGYLGTGDQSNYLKIVATQDLLGEIQIVLEDNDTVLATSYIQADDLFSVPPDQKIFFEFEIDPIAATAIPTVSYETGGGATTTVSGTAIDISDTAVLAAILGDYMVQGQTTGLAVGLMSSNTGQPEADTFQAIFDGIEVTAAGDESQTIIYRVNAGGHEVAAIDGGPNWSADTGSNPSPHLAVAGSNNATATTATPGSTVPGTTPADIFLTQRWDNPTDPEMAWSFETPGSGLYEVRLFFGDGYFGTAAPGERVFDVSIEGEVFANLDDIDLSAQYGSEVGVMISNFVEVSDGSIDIELHHIMQNPIISGIEIIQHGYADPGPLTVFLPDDPLKFAEGAGQILIPVSANKPVPEGETVTITYAITGNTATVLEDYDVPGAQFDPVTGTYTGVVEVVGGATQTAIAVSILQDGDYEGDEVFDVTITDVSPNSLLGNNAASVTIDEDDINPADLRTDILYRVNAGGHEIAAIDGGPNWTIDTGGTNSAYLANPGSNNASASDAEPGSTVPTTTPDAIFLTERWDKPAGSTMQWSFDVPLSGPYEVRLYFGNGYDGTATPGTRVFDVAIEGTVLANLNDVDPTALFGHEVGGMISNVVEITDGSIDIEFLHGIQNPMLNGIEIIAVNELPPTVNLIDDSISIVEGAGQIAVALATSKPVPVGETITVTYVVTPNSATPLVDYDVPGAVFDAGNQTFTGAVDIPAGASQAEIAVAILQDNAFEGNEAFDIAITDVGANALLGVSSGSVTIQDDESDPGAVLYRVNTGGLEIAAIDGGPNWAKDTGPSNSPHLVNPGSNNSSGSDAAPGATVPGTTPAGVFLTERWDKVGGAEMAWSFAVPDAGLYEVRLYMGNGYDGTAAVGKRVFDVSIEGTVLANLDDIDLSALFGHEVGGMISNVVEITDGAIDIEFLHGVQNPLVNAIEIIEVASPPVTVSLAEQSVEASEAAGQILLALATDAPVPTGQTVTVTYEITPVSATPQIDYDIPGAVYDAGTQTYTGNIEIPAGASAAEIAVDILQDSTYEGDETFDVTITDVSGNATIGTGAGTVTILEDDPAPFIDFGAVITVSGSTTAGSNKFKITNTSQDGVVITDVSYDIGTATMSYGLDLSGAPGSEFLGSAWDPTGEAGDAGSQGLWFSTNDVGLLDDQGVPLVPVTTGLGYTGIAGVYPFVEQLPGGNNGAPGGYRHMNLDFGDFDAGEQFAFGVDVDPQSIQGAQGAGSAGGVSGGEMAGTSVTITFEDTATGITYQETRELEATALNGSRAVFAGVGAALAPTLNVVGLTDANARQVATLATDQVVELTGLTEGDLVRLYIFDTSGYEQHGNSSSITAPDDPFHANQLDAAPTILEGVADASGTATFNVALANVPGPSPAQSDGLFFFSAGVIDGLGELISQLSEPAELRVLSVGLTDDPVAALEGDGQVQVGIATSEAVPAGESLTVTYTVTPTGATPLDDYDVPGAQYDAATQTFTGSVDIAAGASAAAITIDILQDTAYEGNEAFEVAISGTSPSTLIGTSTAAVTIVEDDANPGTVVYRVNTGGSEIAAIDGDLDWAADTTAANSPHLIDPGSNDSSSGDALTGITVPTTTPDGIFLSERWDDEGGTEMAWSFAAPQAGLYEVRLFMGNSLNSTSEPGERVFDVSIEGTVLPNLDDVDLADLFGHEVGGMIANTVEVTDGSIDIAFLHNESDPLINGIEIIAMDP